MSTKRPLLCLAAIAIAGLAGIGAQSSPAARLSDEEFGKLFFSGIDLNYSGLEKIRAMVSVGQYGDAFDAWEQVFIERAARIKPGTPRRNGADALEQFHQSVRSDRVKFTATVRGRELAEAIYSATLAPLDNIALFRAALLLPEFKRSVLWWEKAEAALYASMRGNWQPDGSDSELSYSHNERFGGEILELFEDYPSVPRFLVELKLKSRYRDLFLKSLATPWGVQVLGNSASGYESVPSNNRKPPFAGSIAFPWAGLYMMRQGWDRDALFLSLSGPRRGNGHEGEQSNFITLDAYGRRLLIANPGEATSESAMNYFGSSWAQNTINVDGCSQNKTRLPQHGAHEDPLPGRWHTSAHFDFAEDTYSAGYGSSINAVTHERQVIFVRDAGLWIVTDTMDALSTSEHEYAQLWHFTKDLPEIAVVADEANQKLGTREPKASNLFLYHAGIPAVAYREFYGQGDPAAKTSVDAIRARGWQDTGASVFPSVEVHAVWKGSGRQKLVTVLAPSPDASDPVAAFEKIGRAGAAGFKLITKDGTQIQYTSALIGAEQLTLDAGTVQGEALLVVKQKDESRGLFLGPMGGSEFVLVGGEARAVAPIRKPNGFQWLEDGGRLRPDYSRR